MLKKLREPVNSLTHWAGAVLALIGLVALLIVGWSTPAKIISLAIYGVSLVFLFSASATYHMVQVKDKALEIFRKVDHAAIYVLIAGTYTPFCVNAFDGFWKWGHAGHHLDPRRHRYRRQNIHHPRAALAQRGHLHRDGLVEHDGHRRDVERASRLGAGLDAHRRRHLHPGRGCVHHQDLQLQTRRLRLP